MKRSLAHSHREGRDRRKNSLSIAFSDLDISPEMGGVFAGKWAAQAAFCCGFVQLFLIGSK
jgi:hypothetical protein